MRLVVIITLNITNYMNMQALNVTIPNVSYLPRNIDKH